MKKNIFLSAIITIILSFCIIFLNKTAGAVNAGGQGSGDCWGVDIFTNAATENVTTKVTQNHQKPTKNMGSVSVGTTKIKKVTIGKRTAKIKLKSIKDATGYRVMFSTSSRFIKSKTKAMNIKKTNCIVKRIKKSKKYYIKAQAYIKKNRKNYFGKWSKVKLIKR